MGRRITKREHTRRRFLTAAALTATTVVSTGTARASTPASGGLSEAATALLDADVLELNVADYSGRVRPYTTAWGQTVDDWYPAFQAAQDDLRAAGGGRLIVPAGPDTYYTSAVTVFDVPSVTVHLQRDVYVERVGSPDPTLACPLAFYGGYYDWSATHPPETWEAHRPKQDFAALIGPGGVGYPAGRLDRYPIEHGVGISYIRSMLVEGIYVTRAPRTGITAQLGVELVVLRGNRIGPTGQSDFERAQPGNSALNVLGGNWVAGYPLYTRVVYEDNEIGDAFRPFWVNVAKSAIVRGNRSVPAWAQAIQLGAVAHGDIRDNVFGGASVGRPGFYDAVHLGGVEVTQVTGNEQYGNQHRHGLFSFTIAAKWNKPKRVIASRNTWTRGQADIYGGAPLPVGMVER